jgi:hypothetical protein
MSTKRRRASSWEYVVKRKGLLSRPISLTFTDEKEGDSYVARLECLLDAGVVPAELRISLQQLVMAFTFTSKEYRYPSRISWFWMSYMSG